MIRDQDHERLAEVGGRIRKIREAAGLNLHELARLCGISASALSLLETGKRDLRVTSLCRIAAALRVSAGALVDRRSDTPEASTSETGGYDLGDYA